MTCAEIDMSNQIHNSWTKATVLAIGHGGFRYSVLFDVKTKNSLRNFIEKNFPPESKTKRDKRLERRRTRYHNRCISLAHAYLLYLLLYKNISLLTEIRICRDSISKFLHNYLQNISNHKRLDISKIKIGFGLEKNNSVQKYAKEVMKGKTRPDYSLGSKDIQELLDLIIKFVQKEK